MFIALKINPQACSAGKGCAKCVSVCPVDIFQTGDREILVNIENEDECTLCDLCLKACPDQAIEIVRLYEAQ